MLLSNWNKLAAALIAASLIFLADAAAVAPQDRTSPAHPRRKLIVHEWGTFLLVQGSDGVTLGGMIDSEEILPSFVRERSLYGRNRACYGQKMETPVTYFYVDEPRKVELRVGMRKGILTHWFPAVRRFGPPVSVKAKAVPDASFLDWGRVELIPDTPSPSPKLGKDQGGVAGPVLPFPGLKAVGRENTWRFARETDAAFVKISRDNPRVRPEGELEKFLFYRGVGAFRLPLQVHSAGAEDRLTLRSDTKDPLKGIFAIRVEKDAIQFAALPDLPAGASRDVATESILSARLALQDGVPQVKQAVAAALVKAGLYSKEAQAMVNTWEKSYFRTEGLRLLYLLPRGTVDDTIPIEIKPAPTELVRVMIGRIEVLTPATERRLEKAVAALGAQDPAVRKAAHAELTRLGRFQEPVLRRITALTQIPEVRAKAEALIKTAATGR